MSEHYDVIGHHTSERDSAEHGAVQTVGAAPQAGPGSARVDREFTASERSASRWSCAGSSGTQLAAASLVLFILAVPAGLRRRALLALQVQRRPVARLQHLAERRTTRSVPTTRATTCSRWCCAGTQHRSDRRVRRDVLDDRRRALGRHRGLLPRPHRLRHDAHRRPGADPAALRRRGRARPQRRVDGVLVADRPRARGADPGPTSPASSAVSLLSLREKEFIEAAQRPRRQRPADHPHGTCCRTRCGSIIVNATILVATGDPDRDGAVLPRLRRPGAGHLARPARQPVPDRGRSTGRGCSTSPGLFIILIALTVNFIGDGLRDAFDPQQNRVRS